MLTSEYQREIFSSISFNRKFSSADTARQGSIFAFVRMTLACMRQQRENSRFGRRVSMTSNSNWSDRTDSTLPPSNSTTGLGANSPSRVTTGDEYIAGKSDIFREAICARNVYAAWARKMTNARPNDPKLQDYHQEVTKAGETVNTLLKQLDVPLFKIPAHRRKLDKILLRLKSKANDPPAAKIHEENSAVVTPPLPERAERRRNEASMLTASLPQAAC
ncbi:hypothetical protein TNCV_3047211 [Trichonephila clavipes]|nr:hypothetical protein TNCV_3047211 [Trichonephila clavipes]